MADLIFGVIAAVIGIGLTFLGFKAKEMEPFQVNYIFVGLGALVVLIGAGLIAIEVLASQEPEVNLFARPPPLPRYSPEVILLVEPVSGLNECGSNYCFDAIIVDVTKGDFLNGQDIKVELDCETSIFEEIELRGEKKDTGVFASCVNISLMFPEEFE